MATANASSASSCNLGGIMTLSSPIKSSTTGFGQSTLGGEHTETHTRAHIQREQRRRLQSGCVTVHGPPSRIRPNPPVTSNAVRSCSTRSSAPDGDASRRPADLPRNAASPPRQDRRYQPLAFTVQRCRVLSTPVTDRRTADRLPARLRPLVGASVHHAAGAFYSSAVSRLFNSDWIVFTNYIWTAGGARHFSRNIGKSGSLGGRGLCQNTINYDLSKLSKCLPQMCKL